MFTSRMIVAALALVLGASRLEAQGFVVVVNAANPITSLKKDRANGIFLKRATRWDDGSPVLPVNLEPSSPTREAFSRAVHGKGVGAVESVWQQEIFSGKEAPPPQRSSEAEVLSFVRAHPGAIGYVRAGTTLGDDVKVVPVQ
jgi:ABC-type phosphate transport system substrate-binding protein